MYTYLSTTKPKKKGGAFAPPPSLIYRQHLRADEFAVLFGEGPDLHPVPFAYDAEAAVPKMARMYKHVAHAVVRHQKAVAFGDIKPFDGAGEDEHLRHSVGDISHGPPRDIARAVRFGHHFVLHLQRTDFIGHETPYLVTNHNPAGCTTTLAPLKNLRKGYCV